VATLQHDIIEQFLAALSARKDFPAEKVEELRALFAAGKRLKADDFAAIFSKPAGADLR
jgi:hypothetical protein